MSYPPPAPYGGGYPPPGYGGYAPPQPNPTNGLATAALVFGILSIVCFPGLCIVAIPLALAGMGRSKSINGSGRGLAIGGLVTGLIGLLICIGIAILLVIGANAADDVNSDPSDGICNEDRFLQDPDC